jgi:hypothetical protein
MRGEDVWGTCAGSKNVQKRKRTGLDIRDRMRGSLAIPLEANSPQFFHSRIWQERTSFFPVAAAFHSSCSGTQYASLDSGVRIRVQSLGFWLRCSGQIQRLGLTG